MNTSLDLRAAELPSLIHSQLRKGIRRSVAKKALDPLCKYHGALRAFVSYLRSWLCPDTSKLVCNTCVSVNASAFSSAPGPAPFSSDRAPLACAIGRFASWSPAHAAVLQQMCRVRCRPPTSPVRSRWMKDNVRLIRERWVALRDA